MELSDRQMQILRAVIEEYQSSVTPVGSRALARRPDLGFSAATIRNEMADLEAMGYLEKPHTSAGRLPTRSAYRLYVGAMQGDEYTLTEDEQSTLQDRFSVAPGEVGEVCSAAAETISSITGCIGVALSPSLGQVPVRHIQVVRLGAERSVAVIITDSGMVLKEVLRIGDALSDADLEQISNMITGDVAGLRVKDAAQHIQDMSKDLRNGYKLVMRELVSAINRNRDSVETFLSGREKMWDYPEYRDWRSARCLEALLDTRERLVRLLEPGRPLNVGFSISIAPEAAGVDLPDLGVVTGGYKAGNTGAVFGAIGPARMNYAKVLPVLRSVGRRMSSALRDFGITREKRGT